MNYTNLTKLNSFSSLSKMNTVSIKDKLTKERILSSSIDAGGGLSYNWACLPVDDEIISVLQALADESEVIEKYKAILSGEVMNVGEKRLVLHHLLRGSVIDTAIEIDGENKKDFYQTELKKIETFSNKVRNGEIVGSTGKPFTTVCQIGIGGSDLGPRAMYLALKGYATGENIKQLKAEFISNVDPDDAASVIESIDPETTLFILVSKSGTTQETLTNRDLILKTLSAKNIKGLNPSAHMVAVTSKTSPLAKDKTMLDAFYIDDYIGGRYSSTSAVGGVVLSLALGFDVFKSFLDGAADSDKKAYNPSIKENAALFDALCGVYMRNILSYESTAILPYSQALSRFPAHLQQLDMESNGKSVNRLNEEVDYQTGPVIFGEPGTNGQHSFYQLLHQGTNIIPLQFIGFKNNQYNLDMETFGSTSQEKLNANLVAQIVAFALGSDNENPNKQFNGERPSSLIYGEKLTPFALGALLAHYENKVMFQGFIWNLNSFDQEGVQLGKKLADKVLSGNTDDILESFVSLLK